MKDMLKPKQGSLNRNVILQDIIEILKHKD